MSLQQDQWEYQELSFISHFYFIEKYKEKISKKDGFFKLDPPRSCFVVVNIESQEQNLAVQLAIQKINDSLSDLKAELQKDCVLSYSGYAHFDSDTFYINSMFEGGVNLIYDHHIESIDYKSKYWTKTNNFEILETLTRILNNAYSEKELSNSLSLYWKIADIIIDLYKKEANNNQLSDLDIIAKISVFIEKKLVQDLIRMWSHNCVINSQNLIGASSGIGLSRKEVIAHQNYGYLRGVSYFLDRVKHPHIRYRLNQVKYYKTKINMKQRIAFFKGLYFELYNYRNAFEHSTSADDETGRMIRIGLHRISNNILKFIITESNKAEKKSPGEVLKQLFD